MFTITVSIEKPAGVTKQHEGEKGRTLTKLEKIESAGELRTVLQITLSELRTLMSWKNDVRIVNRHATPLLTELVNCELFYLVVTECQEQMLKFRSKTHTYPLWR